MIYHICGLFEDIKHKMYLHFCFALRTKPFFSIATNNKFCVLAPNTRPVMVAVIL